MYKDDLVGTVVEYGIIYDGMDSAELLIMKRDRSSSLTLVLALNKKSELPDIMHYLS